LKAGGSIELDQGTERRIAHAVRQAIAFGKHMKGSAHTQPSRRMLAVVDDDPAVRGSLQFSLELEGYEVRVFSDARELLNDPAIAHFDCIIIDRNLPTFDGLELAVQLRDRSVFVPVILTTSQPSEFLARRARSAGISIVEKPLLDNALVERIQALLQC
jgi:two-component system response regulator FixJ